MSRGTERRMLTTGEVARLCHVASRTVGKWFDEGQIGGYRIPGSNDRRIDMGSLIRFMRKHGMPVQSLLVPTGRPRQVVLLGDDETELTLMRRLLEERAGFEVTVVTSLFSAGVETARLEPAALVVEANLPGVDYERLCLTVRAEERMSLMRLVAIGSHMTPGRMQMLRGFGFDACLVRPFDLARLINAITCATEAI